MMKTQKILFFCMLFILSSIAVSAEVYVVTDKLNYDSSSDVINVWIRTDEVGVTVNYTLPSPLNFETLNTCGGSSVGTTCVAQTATRDGFCLSMDPGDVCHLVLSPDATDLASTNEYDIGIMEVNSPTDTENSPKFININDDEIFYTLVEYGRGRGNYFYNSMGRESSSNTGSGCPYLPNGTGSQLNYLHKVFNIKQYYAEAMMTAYNTTFTCEYPEDTVIRQHLVTGIQNTGTNWIADYLISEIEGSWERMGYLGQQFDGPDMDVGRDLLVNCTDIRYYLPKMGGNISVDEDSFTLQVRNMLPVNITANVLASTIGGNLGNGTQEVMIEYTITNTELYELEDVVIELNSPPYSQFIGVRGEIWGTGREIYRVERIRMAGGESFSIILTARVDLRNAGPITSLDMSGTNLVSFIPCYESQAYNPTELIQTIPPKPGSAYPVNMTQNVTPPSIIKIINETNSVVKEIREEIKIINNTVRDINNTVKIINESVYNMTRILEALNVTIEDINFTVHNLSFDCPSCNFNITVNETVVVINMTNVTTVVNVSVNKTVFNSSDILEKIMRLQEFDEELVFLVTDSIGLRQEAAKSMDRGDMQDAMNKYSQANENLRQASERMALIEQKLSATTTGNTPAVTTGTTTETSGGFLPQASGGGNNAVWMLALIGVLAYLVMHMYHKRNEGF